MPLHTKTAPNTDSARLGSLTNRSDRAANLNLSLCAMREPVAAGWLARQPAHPSGAFADGDTSMPSMA
jgi:hypothetical protein